MMLHLHTSQFSVVLGWCFLAVCIGASGCATAPADPLPPPFSLIVPFSEVDEVPEEMPSKNFELDSLLTENLHDDGLPGVGVHVWSDDMGNGLVMLYGFVDSEKQKRQAEEQTREISSDMGFQLSDRLRIRPKLLTARRVWSSPSR